MLQLTQLTGFGGSADVPYYVALDTDSSVADQTSYTFTGLNFGDPSANRVLLVFFTASSNGVAQLKNPSCTIGGIAATVAQSGGWSNGSDLTNHPLGFFYATVPTGTSGNVVISFGSGTATSCSVCLHALYNVNTPPRLSGDFLNDTDYPTLELDSDEIAVFGLWETSVGTWTGATQTLTVSYDVSDVVATAVYQGSGTLSVSNTTASAYGRCYVVFGNTYSRPRRSIQLVGTYLDGFTGSTGAVVETISTISLWRGTSHTLQENDLIVVLYAAGSSSDLTLSITNDVASGGTEYTLIGSELYANATTYDTNLRVAYKFYNGTDTEIRWGSSGSSSNERGIGYLVFRGVDTTTPLDVAATTATNTGDLDTDPPSITPTTAGAYIVCVGACASATTNFQFNDDLHGVRSYTFDGTNDITIGYGLKPDWTSGAFDAAQFRPTISAPAQGWAALTFALRPAS